MKNIRLKYNHAAVPPKGISLNTIYVFGKDGDGEYIKNKFSKIYMPIEKIKVMFETINGTCWDKCLNEDSAKEEKQIKNSELSENDKHEIENLKHFKQNMKKKFKNKQKEIKNDD